MLSRLLGSFLKRTPLGLIASAFVTYAWSLNCIGNGNKVEKTICNFEFLGGNIFLSYRTRADRRRCEGAGRLLLAALSNWEKCWCPHCVILCVGVSRSGSISSFKAGLVCSQLVCAPLELEESLLLFSLLFPSRRKTAFQTQFFLGMGRRHLRMVWGVRWH